MLTLARAKPWETTLAAGAALVLFPMGGFLALMAIGSAWYGPFVYPLPLATALPFLLLSSPLNLGHMSWILPSAFFWVWGIHLFRGSPKVPVRTEALFWLLVVLTVVYFAVSWKYGVTWQGYFHLISVTILNVVAILLLWGLLFRAKAVPTFNRNLAFHWALVAWLAWFAFPWLGEGL
jgi:hypothetical protein